MELRAVCHLGEETIGYITRDAEGQLVASDPTLDYVLKNPIYVGLREILPEDYEFLECLAIAYGEGNFHITLEK